MTALRARRLAVCAMLIPAAALPAKPPAPRTPVTQEELYQSAMGCKVRVEALVPLARNERERKRSAAALAFWVEHERAAAAKLGKGDMQVMADEMLFGVAEADHPDALARADLCLRAPSMVGSR